MKKMYSLAILVFSIFACTPAVSAKFITLEKPVPTSVSSDKIEVVEVFWYGCGHCFALEQEVQKWLKHKPKNVEFVRTPAPLNDFWEIHARIFYIADALNQAEKFHPLIFNEILKKRNYLDDKIKIADFFHKYNYEKDKIIELYNSFGINSAITNAKSKVMGYKITSVPQVIVDGRYVVSAATAGGAENIFPVVNQIIAKLNKQNKVKK